MDADAEHHTTSAEAQVASTSLAASEADKCAAFETERLQLQQQQAARDEAEREARFQSAQAKGVAAMAAVEAVCPPEQELANWYKGRTDVETESAENISLRLRRQHLTTPPKPIVSTQPFTLQSVSKLTFAPTKMTSPFCNSVRVRQQQARGDCETSRV
jgi:hypothetical protein